MGCELGMRSSKREEGSGKEVDVGHEDTGEKAREIRDEKAHPGAHEDQVGDVLGFHVAKIAGDLQAGEREERRQRFAEEGMAKSHLFGPQNAQ